MDAFGSLLAVAHAAVTASDVKAYQRADQALRKAMPAPATPSQDYKGVVRQVMGRIPAGRPDLQLYLASWLVDHLREPHDYLVYLDLVERAVEALDHGERGLEATLAIYERAISFAHTIADLERFETLRVLHRIHAKLVERVRIRLAEHGSVDPDPQGSHRIALVTPCYLEAPGHGPSDDIRQAAMHLRDACGYEPVIISARQTSGRVCRIIHRAYVEPFDPAISARGAALLPDGSACRFIQPTTPLISFDAIAQVHRQIAAVNPRVVLGFFAGNWIADLFTRRVTTAAWMTNGRFLPSHADTVIRPCTTNTWEQAIGQERGREPESLYANTGAFAVPETGERVSRRDLGLGPDHKVACIVSTGLARDVCANDAFAHMLARLARRDPRVRFLLIGSGIERAHIEAVWPGWADRFVLAGFQSDVRAYARLGDVFINPPRGGGATGAITAMAEGVPVVTLAQGDVGIIADQTQTVCDVDAMEERILQLIGDPASHNAQSQVSRQVWQARSDVAGMWARIGARIDPDFARTSDAPARSA